MSDTQHLSDVRFDSLGLDPALMQGIRDTGFDYCTPIQAQTLPLMLAGRDVAGQAQTGTGKTAAFLLATMQHLLRHPGEENSPQPRALILAPTRELAIQIHADATQLGAHAGLKLGLAYGGTGYQSQREQLEAGVDILIGTPGRLIDYFKQHVFNLRHIQVSVMDEADRMFDLGFIKDIRYLLRRMPEPEKRLNMLFSATLSLRVTELAYEHMNNPEAVKIETEQVTADKVRQRLFHVANDEKISLVLGLLGTMENARVMIFINTKRDGERLQDYLRGNGINSAILSGDVPQNMRQRLLADFNSGKIDVLVATDVAARGLHIPGVTHVINYDLPQDAEDYVHRIGRTARAGASGEAISLCCERYCYSLPEIENYIGDKIAVDVADESLRVTPAPPARRPRRESGPGDNRRRGRPRSSNGNRGRHGRGNRS